MRRHRGIALAWLLLAGCGGGSGGGDAPSPPAGVPELETAALDFGAVVVGDRVARFFTVRNPDDGESARITDLVLTRPGDYDLGPELPPLPHTLAPGSGLTFTVFAVPSGVGDRNATLSLLLAGGDSLAATLRASGIASERTVDFGAQPLSALLRETDDLEVVVPAEAVSLTLEAFGATSAGGPIFLASLVGPGGKVYVDAADPHGGPYRFDRSFPSDLGQPTLPLHDTRFVIPNTDDPDAQLVAGGGIYRFRLSHRGGSLAALEVRAHVELRSSGNVTEGHVDLNVFLAAGLPISASNAATDPRLADALGEAQRLLEQAGVGFGTVRYFELADPAFDTRTGNDTGPLFRQSAVASRDGLNLFFVVSIPFAVAGAIPGSARHGTPFSGVVVPFPGFFTPEAIGITIAHEMAHYLGLGHTFENPACPGPTTGSATRWSASPRAATTT